MSFQNGTAWGFTSGPVDDWRELAACARHSDWDLWFPVGKGALANCQYAQARQICLSCPVLAACERWARTVRPEFGMLAGLTPEERRERHGEPIRAIHQEPTTPRSKVHWCYSCGLAYKPHSSRARLCLECGTKSTDSHVRAAYRRVAVKR